MIEQVLVDVDNLRHVLMDVFPGFPRKFGDSRKATANHLSTYGQHYKRQIIAFVDGGPGPEGESSMTRANVRAVFAPNKGKADDEIADYVYGHRNLRRVLVVSSDQVVANHARAHGASVQSSQEFAKTLLRITGEAAKNTRHQSKNQHDAPTSEKSKYRRGDFADVEAAMLRELEDDWG